MTTTRQWPNRLITTPYCDGYCRQCGEWLRWGDGECPHCHAPFDPDDPTTYRRRPLFRRVKFWLPGFVLALASGVVSYGVCLTSGNDLGFALFVAVPVSMGAILGYATRLGLASRFFVCVMLIFGTVLSLVTLNLAGFFCGATLSLVFLVPVGFGALLGVILREQLKNSRRWYQRIFLPLMFFVALPYAVQAIESTWPRRVEIATVRTSLRVDATPAEAFQAILFYEQVDHDPPWLLRLSLPRPVRCEGTKTAVGNLVRCHYDRGYLVKRISERIENQRLSFTVVEQKLHFERDVELLDGAFEVVVADEMVRSPSPIEATSCDIVLTTRYRRKLYPAWIWSPIEQDVVHTLHAHVLEGMRRKIGQARVSTTFAMQSGGIR